MSDAGDQLLNLILSMLSTAASSIGVPLALCVAAWLVLKAVARRIGRATRRRGRRRTRAIRRAPASRTAIRPGCDPRRAFTDAERRALFAFCGYRCEQVDAWGRRCSAAAEHADHIVPWSKGGPTDLGNAAGMCAAHNLAKGSRMPTAADIARLERLRSTYALAA